MTGDIFDKSKMSRLEIDSRHTFFEASQSNLRILHIDLTKKTHVREAFYDLPLTTLWDSVIVRRHVEPERRVGDITRPEMSIASGLLVQFLVRRTLSVKFIHRSKFRYISGCPFETLGYSLDQNASFCKQQGMIFVI